MCGRKRRHRTEEREKEREVSDKGQGHGKQNKKKTGGERHARDASIKDKRYTEGRGKEE